MDVPTGGGLVNLDMRTNTSYTDTMSLGELNIVYSLTITFPQDILADWNLIGLPLDVLDPYYKSVYPDAITDTLFRFNGSYIPEDSMDVGTGYWLRFPAAQVQNVQGFPVNSVTLNLAADWNIIAGPSCNVALSDVSDPGGIIISGTLFEFNGTYVPADSIKQGRGYWLRTNSAEQIMISCGAEGTGTLAKAAQGLIDLSPFPALHISDATGAQQTLHFNVKLPKETNTLSYSLPPLPPAGAFDACFADDLRISETDQAAIRVQSSHFPLTIRASNMTPENGYQYVIEAMVPGKQEQTYVLNSGEDVRIRNPRIRMLKLTRQKVVPLTFSVAQNYPNPFNPTTEIRYTIPQTANVEISIYNTLGQKVKTLVSESQDAGRYRATWDATNDEGRAVSSGIYFYTVKAGEHSTIKKMMLVK